MKTSNFSKNGNNSRAVSISLSVPKFYKGKEYKVLAPPYWLLKHWKENYNIEYYIKIYNQYVLNKLNPEKVYTDLVNLVGENGILLCWEAKPLDNMSIEDILNNTKYFCHRHLVAEWFKKELGINVEEV